MTRLFETLENRRLLHAEFAASINFQPIGAAHRAPGFLTDYGGVYAARRGGLRYGWSVDVQANAVDRDLTKLNKNDTYITMPATGEWDIAVENGTYQVYIVAGDPGTFNDRVAITAEGEVAVSGITKNGRRYIEGLTDVTVADGKLTIASAPWATANKICYIGIVSTEETTANTLTVDTPVPLAKESGSVSGRFRISRGGDTDEAVTVPVTMSGTATNGADYGRFGTAVTFAAGVTSIDLPVRPVADGVNEPDETVTLTIGAVNGHTLVEPSATVTIQDSAATSTPTTLSWSTKAARPVAASELLSAAVGGKLYTFGGFVDQTFHPTTANYAYDPSTNTWSRKADLPIGITHAGVASDDAYIYFAGGYPGNGSAGAQTFSTKAVYRYDPTANTYTSLPDLPVARGAGSLGKIGSVLYFMGGDNSSRVDVKDVYALDLNNLAAGWVTKASLPALRNHAAAVTLGGYLYLIGGQTDQDAGLTTHPDVYRYNPSTNAWSTVASMPGGRSHITDSTFVYDDKIVVLAGQSAYESALSSNLEYDPATNKWSTIASLPASRFSGGAHYFGGVFVYAGGYSGGFKNTTYVGTLT